MSPSLVWSPVHRTLEQRIKDGDEIILLLVPFVKLAALQQLHWVHATNVKLKLICRWRPEDLLAGASDVEIYPYLKASGCQLYLNPEIHLKLYVFSSNAAFNTSGNLTLQGLGYTDQRNIEVGSIVQLTAADWAKIFAIINSSRQVDDEVYSRFKAFLDQQPRIGPTATMPDFFPAARTYTISSLPATDSPRILAKFYFTTDIASFTPDQVRRAVHDLVTFDVPNGLSPSEFDQRLCNAFLQNPFVRDFTQLLKKEGSLRFGAVSNWIHQRCEDVPLPYRWEVKEITRIFYDWLACYVPGIAWDRPQYSQIIRWKEQ